MGWPAEGIATSRYGKRHVPHPEGSGFHKGIDIANLDGTPIFATADGIVRYADWKSGYGRTIVLEHGNGYTSVYGHNAEIRIRPGARVKCGQIIALMGTSGRSTGSHLHYEIRRYGRSIDPWQFMGEEQNPKYAVSAPAKRFLAEGAPIFSL